jgi:hypothetical protein
MTDAANTSSDAPKPVSFRTQWARVVADSDLHATTKLVGHTLTTWMDADGHCWPSLASIGRRASLQATAVKTHLKRLEEAGFIERDRGGPGHSTRYQALVATATYIGREDGQGRSSGRLGVGRDGGHEVSTRSLQLKSAYKADGWEKPNPEPPRLSDEKCQTCQGWAKHRPWCSDAQQQVNQGLVAEVAKSEEEVPVR